MKRGLRKDEHLLFSLFFLFLLAGTASSATTQYFDSEGRLLPGEQGRTLKEGGALFRYSAPEGVDLRRDVSYEYYPVAGKTYSEIVRSTTENGPYNEAKKRRFPTKLKWGFGLSCRYEYSYAVDEEEAKVHVALEITDVEVSYSVTLTMPALLDNTSLNPVEKGLWKSHFMKLLSNEYDRIDIIEDPEERNSLINGIKDIDYLIFDYRDDIDIDAAVDQFIREEGAKSARNFAKKIKAKMDEHDLEKRS